MVLGKELCKEYTYRYGKVHSCEKHFNEMMNFTPPIPSKGFTNPAQAMPDEYKDEGNSVKAYWNYYIGDKLKVINKNEKPYTEYPFDCDSNDLSCSA